MDRTMRKFMAYWTFMGELAALSTCKRAQQAAIVVAPDFSMPLAIGYNGPPVGTPNDSCTGGEGTCGCVHAEANAVARLRTPGGFMVATTMPCLHCAGLMANSRMVRGLVYDRPYRDDRGHAVLTSAGIHVVRYEDMRAQGWLLDEMLKAVRLP
jgi:deoxycytidylate deaminase